MMRAMKTLLACTLGVAMGAALTATAQVAEAPAERSATVKSAKLLPVSESDIYCGGFIAKEGVPQANYIGGGWSNPNAARFAAGEFIYITGPALKQGELYSIVRQSEDPDRSEFYRGQHKAVSSLGEIYAEIGRAKVVGEGQGSSIAQVIFSCESAVSGDWVIPFQQREKINVRNSIDFDRFTPASKNLSGRIVMARDFDAYVGNGQKAYLNIGSAQGVKVGDYFRAVRPYTIASQDAADAISYRATITDDTQKHQVLSDASGSHFNREPKFKLASMPLKSLGELVVINVTPTSSTTMVTYALEELQVGDRVERDELPPAPPAPVAEMRPPTISCIAQPNNVRAGNASAVNCDVFSPDNRPVSIVFSTDRGQLSVNGSTGLLRTTNLEPGPVNVTATAMDDRHLSTAITTLVTVQTPLPTAAPMPTATPSKIAEVSFKANSTYVDNEAQTSMNQVAQRMQSDPQAQVVILGMGKLTTPAGQRIAMRRAENLKAYLVHKGVEAGRIEARTQEDNDRAEIWLLPAGTEMPK